MSSSWERDTARVCVEMREHSHHFGVPLHRVVSNDFGELCGTGSYLRLLGKTYLLTNDHVAQQVQHGGLSHQPIADEFSLRVTQPFLSVPAPVDTAISRVEEEIWQRATKKAIPADRISMRHGTATAELLFVQGYPGERSLWSAMANGSVSRSVPYLTQEAQLPAGLDPRVYFALLYSPEHAKAIDGSNAHLPLPPGFSGSLVWDTRFVAASGSQWKPDLARVTGLVAMWGQGELANVILAVRIEVVREMIVRALRQEAAYFRWLNRGDLSGDMLSDWLWAEASIRDLA